MAQALPRFSPDGFKKGIATPVWQKAWTINFAEFPDSGVAMFFAYLPIRIAVTVIEFIAHLLAPFRGDESLLFNDDPCSWSHRGLRKIKCFNQNPCAVFATIGSLNNRVLNVKKLK